MSTSLLNRSMVRGEFHAGLNIAPHEQHVQALALQTQSRAASETYGFADAAPAVKELTGAKDFKALGARSFSLTNKKYGTGVVLDAQDMNRDQTGTIRERIASLSSRIADFRFRLLIDLIKNGTTLALAPSYDGLALFSASHSMGKSGTQKNLLTASEVAALNVVTTTDIQPEEFVLCVMNTIAYMRSYLDDEGEPMMEPCQNWAVIVPTQGVFGPAITALRANSLTSGKTNILTQAQQEGRFSLDLIDTPRLTTQTEFYIACLDAPGRKPFVLQEDMSMGSNPEMKYWDESSDFYKDNDAYKVFATWRGAVGVAEPLSIAKCTVS